MEIRYFLSVIVIFALGIGAATFLAPSAEAQATQRGDRAHTSSVSGVAIATRTPGGPRRYSRGSRPETVMAGDLDSQSQVPALHFEAETDSVPTDLTRRGRRVAQR